MTDIYEVIDSTDGDRYYPLGVYLSLDDAISAIIEASEDGQKISEQADEYEEITIKKRSIGWSDEGIEVFKQNRQEIYDEENDRYIFVEVENDKSL